MSYRNFKGKRKETAYPHERREDYMDHTTYQNSRPDNREGQPAVGMSVLALRNLPRSAFAIQADPYEASLPSADPYSIINAFNKKIGGQYAGIATINGGNMQQYPNSLRSNFLKIADFIRMVIALNYRFMPRKFGEGWADEDHHKALPHVGGGLIDQCRQSIAEATSALQATTFTQMAINDYVVETDMPMGNAEFTTVTIDGEQHKLYTKLPDVIYAISSMYQIILQEAISVVNNFNSFRLKQGTLIRSSWNRETPKYNSLFGLLNKKAFLSLIDSLCLAFEGEYVDRDWIQTVNMLSTIPSRRSNAMMDPVLELELFHTHPETFKMYLKTGNNQYEEIFSLDDLNYLKPGAQEETSFFYNALHFKDMVSSQHIAHWARSNELSDSTTDNAFYNDVKSDIDAMISALTVFKIKMADVREVFDVLARTGLNTWVKHYRPAITKSTDAALFENVIVEDIYKTVFSGDSQLQFDNDTKRWKFFTTWDLYNGIPAYDAKTGGAFLSFSAKNVDLSEDSDHTFIYLPIAFYPANGISGTGAAPVSGDPITLKATTRDGQEINITRTNVALGGANAVESLARLAPLPSQSDEQMVVPVATVSDKATASHLAHTLSSIFKVAIVNDKYYVDPDLISIYQIEVPDITNDAVAYARTTCVFRGTSPMADGLGFSRLGQVAK